MPGSSPSSTNGGKQRPGCQELSARPVREWERRSWHRSRGVPTISSSGALKRPIIRSSSPSSAIRPAVSAAVSMRDTGSSWRGRRASDCPAGRRVLAEGDFSIDHRGRSARRSRAQPGRRRRRDHGHSILPHPGCGRFGAARRRNYLGGHRRESRKDRRPSRVHDGNETSAKGRLLRSGSGEAGACRQSPHPAGTEPPRLPRDSRRSRRPAKQRPQLRASGGERPRSRSRLARLLRLGDHRKGDAGGMTGMEPETGPERELLIRNQICKFGGETCPYGRTPCRHGEPRRFENFESEIVYIILHANFPSEFPASHLGYGDLVMEKQPGDSFPAEKVPNIERLIEARVNSVGRSPVHIVSLSVDRLQTFPKPSATGLSQ